MIQFKFKPIFKNYLMLHYLITRMYFVILGIVALMISGLCIAGPYISTLFIKFLASTNPKMSVPSSSLEALGVTKENLVYACLPWIVLFYSLLSSYLRMRKRWIQSPELSEEREYLIDEEGVHVKGRSFSGTQSWTLLKRAAYASGYFYIATNQNTYHYFPADVLPNVTEFVELVRTRIGPIKGYNNDTH